MKPYWILLVSLPLAAPSMGAPPSPVSQTKLQGRWQFNASLSEDPRQKMKQQQPGPGDGGAHRGGGGGSWGGRRGGFGGTGPGNDGGGGGGANSGDREFMKSVFEAPSRLDIVQAEGEVDLVDDLGNSRKLYTDGHKVKGESSAGETETVSRWNNASLETETKVPSGLRVQETYALGNDGRQLLVNFHVQNPRSSRDFGFKRVYDLQPAP